MRSPPISPSVYTSTWVINVVINTFIRPLICFLLIRPFISPFAFTFSHVINVFIKAFIHPPSVNPFTQSLCLFINSHSHKKTQAPPVVYPAPYFTGLKPLRRGPPASSTPRSRAGGKPGISVRKPQVRKGSPPAGERRSEVLWGVGNRRRCVQG